MLKKLFSILLSSSIVLSGITSVFIIAPEEIEASEYNDLAKRPFMGWSSWSSIRKKPTEEKMKVAADIMAAKFKSHGYQYVNLDDYYQLNWTTTVDKYGRWAVDPEKFPNGMKALGDYIHKKGLKFGLYVTFGIPKGALDQNTPIEGTPYHARDIVDLTKGQKVSFNFDNMYSIDYSKPGAQEYIDSWARLFASYGIDYLKIDGVRNEDIPDIEAWAKALKKIGRPIHVELSNNLDIKYAATWQQLSNGWRTDHDVEAYGKNTLTNWKKVSRRFDDAAQWQPHAGPGGWNDFDSLNVANGSKDGLTKAEKRSYVSLWAIAASHFVIGNDLMNLDNFGVSLLTNDEIISVNQSGVAGKRLFKTKTSQVFYQTLPDGSYNVGIFNTGPSTEKITVEWSDLGIEGSAAVRDLWTHKELGKLDSGFTAKLDTHDSRMIHLVPDSSLTVSPKSGATEVPPSSITFKWGSQAGTESYHVQVADDPDFEHIIFDRTLFSTSAKVKNLKYDKRYYWKVSTVADGTETLLGTYSFNTMMTNAPATPDWIMADRKNKESVSITWNPTAGATSYTVYRKKVNGLGFSSGYTPIASNLKDPSFLDETAAHQAGTQYSYLVKAVNAVGNSAKSTEVHTDKPSTAQVAVALFGFITLALLVIFITNTTVRNKSNRAA